MSARKARSRSLLAKVARSFYEIITPHEDGCICEECERSGDDVILRDCTAVDIEAIGFCPGMHVGEEREIATPRGPVTVRDVFIPERVAEHLSIIG